MKKIKKMSASKKLVIGAGMVAAGAGAYYLFGPKAKAHQKKTKVLMLKMKREIEKEAKKIKKITIPLYQKTVNTIASNYTKQYKLHEKDIKAFACKMKKDWKGAKKIAKKAVRVAKKGL